MKLRAKFERGEMRTRYAEPAPAREPEPDVKPAPSAAARNLALAHHIERLIERGVVADYSEAARALGVSQVRVTHVVSLLLLSPAIQEAILVGELAPGDKELREVARMAAWTDQETGLRR